jgi:hypothetical protein
MILFLLLNFLARRILVDDKLQIGKSKFQATASGMSSNFFLKIFN